MELGHYNINTTSIKEIKNTDRWNGNKTITNHFWYPNPHILHRLETHLEKKNIRENIIDIGCGATAFTKATHLVDFSLKPYPNKIKIKLDLDFDTFPYKDHHFNFLYCRHTLEDILNPLHAFKELQRISPRGYIETPSPLIEISKGVDAGNPPPSYCGYRHHRYIIWSDIENNTLYALPKMPLVEHLDIDSNNREVMNYIANNYPLYWNNYYFWNESNPPNIVMYRNDINMNINKDYTSLLMNAISKSMEYANHFLSIV